MKKYKVDKRKCAGCGACVSICPNKAIKIGKDGRAKVDPKKCRGCGICKEICPFDTIEHA